MKCKFMKNMTISHKGAKITGQRRCGQCTACRITRKQEYQLRIILESRLHEHSSFVTLTYNDNYYPEGGNLSKRDLQLFIKRLRKRLKVPIKYFAVGEYGENTHRAHYHLIIFGAQYQYLEYHVRRAWSEFLDINRAEPDADENYEEMGMIECAQANSARAAYVARYTVKKMTSMQDERLDGRQPEFQIHSNNLALKYAHKLADQLVDSDDVIGTSGMTPYIRLHKLPIGVRTEGKLLPLDKYMRQAIIDRICETLGIEPPSIMEVAMVSHSRKFRDMYVNAEYDPYHYEAKLDRQTKRKKGEL